MARTLEKKEGRAYAVRLIAAVLASVTRDKITVETGEGEGQGEVSFENFSILGQEDGYAVSFATEVPATRWEPSDVDIHEVGVVASLDEAIDMAVKLYVGHMIDMVLEGEREAISYGEEMEELE